MDAAKNPLSDAATLDAALDAVLAEHDARLADALRELSVAEGSGGAGGVRGGGGGSGATPGKRVSVGVGPRARHGGAASAASSPVVARGGGAPGAAVGSGAAPLAGVLTPPHADDYLHVGPAPSALAGTGELRSAPPLPTAATVAETGGVGAMPSTAAALPGDGARGHVAGVTGVPAGLLAQPPRPAAPAAPRGFPSPPADDEGGIGVDSDDDAGVAGDGAAVVAGSGAGAALAGAGGAGGGVFAGDAIGRDAFGDVDGGLGFGTDAFRDDDDEYGGGGGGGTLGTEPGAAADGGADGDGAEIAADAARGAGDYDESLPDGGTVRRRRLSRDEADELPDGDKDAGLADAYKQEGNRHFGAGDFDSAAAAYTEALRTVPRGAEFDGPRSVFWANRAACALHAGRAAAALYDCDRALEAAPGYAKALARRSAALERLGKLDEAAKGETAGVCWAGRGGHRVGALGFRPVVGSASVRFVAR